MPITPLIVAFMVQNTLQQHYQLFLNEGCSTISTAQPNHSQSLEIV